MSERQVRRPSLALDLALSGMLAALVLAFTFINIRLPISVNGGLIHLGNVPLVVAAITFDKKKGAIAGALGMGLFDIMGGWMLWAPFTVVIRGAMGCAMGWIAERGKHRPAMNLLAVLAGGVIIIAGYYFTEVILYGNWVAPFTSVPGNALQVLTAVVLGLPLAMMFRGRVKY